MSMFTKEGMPRSLSLLLLLVGWKTRQGKQPQSEEEEMGM